MNGQHPCGVGGYEYCLKIIHPQVGGVMQMGTIFFVSETIWRSCVNGVMFFMIMGECMYARSHENLSLCIKTC